MCVMKFNVIHLLREYFFPALKGKDSLQNFAPSDSKLFPLEEVLRLKRSVIYDNHCLPSTCVNLLNA